MKKLKVEVAKALSEWSIQTLLVLEALKEAIFIQIVRNLVIKFSRYAKKYDLYVSVAFGSASPLQASPSFKHYDFEAEKEVAEEIVQKINLILNMRTSQSRREYLAVKEKKHMNKRKSFKYLKP